MFAFGFSNAIDPRVPAGRSTVQCIMRHFPFSYFIPVLLAYSKGVSAATVSSEIEIEAVVGYQRSGVYRLEIVGCIPVSVVIAPSIRRTILVFKVKQGPIPMLQRIEILSTSFIYVLSARLELRECGGYITLLHFMLLMVGLLIPFKL